MAPAREQGIAEVREQAHERRAQRPPEKRPALERAQEAPDGRSAHPATSTLRIEHYQRSRRKLWIDAEPPELCAVGSVHESHDLAPVAPS